MENNIEEQESKVNDLTASLNQEKQLIKSVQNDCDLNTVVTTEHKEFIEAINRRLNSMSLLTERIRRIPVVIQLSSWGDITKSQPIMFSNGEDHYMLHVEGTIKKIVIYAQHPVICHIDGIPVTTSGISQRPETTDHNIRVNMRSIVRFNATEAMDTFYAELYVYPSA